MSAQKKMQNCKKEKSIMYEAGRSSKYIQEKEEEMVPFFDWVRLSVCRCLANSSLTATQLHDNMYTLADSVKLLR
jgi:predicted phosphoadenosine phosphosulfate sulfurtransferase